MSDEIQQYLSGELVGPPPIPPKEFLQHPEPDCKEIIKHVNNCSSLLNGPWSSYTDSCLPVKLTTSAITTAEITTDTYTTITEDFISTIVHTKPPIVTGVISDTTATGIVFNITKSPQSVLNAGIPGWLIGVILAAVLVFIVIIILVVICIIKTKKGDRCKLSKWISSHSQWWTWWPRQRHQTNEKSQHTYKGRQQLTRTGSLELQSPLSEGSVTMLPDSPEITPIHVELTSSSLSEEIFKELDTKYEQYPDSAGNSQNYVEFTKKPHSDKVLNEKDNINWTNYNINDQEIVVIITNNEKMPKKSEGHYSSGKYDSVELTSCDEKLNVSHHLTLEDKDSANSLTLDSGYTSRQVSDDNCAC